MNSFFPESLRIAGVDVPLGPHLSPAVLSALTRDYESREISAVRSTLRPTDVVLELGAGLGLMAAVCARVVGAHAVFAFEANPALEQPIRRLFAMNGVSPNLDMCALAERSGTMALEVADDFWESSTVSAKSQGSTVQVHTKRFAEVRGAVRPSFLIVDIEGGELEFFEHAVLDGVRTIVVELHPKVIGKPGCTQVIAQLDRTGFRIDPLTSTKSVLVLHRKLSRDDLFAHLRWRSSGALIGFGLQLRRQEKGRGELIGEVKRLRRNLKVSETRRRRSAAELRRVQESRWWRLGTTISQMLAHFRRTQ